VKSFFEAYFLFGLVAGTVIRTVYGIRHKRAVAAFRFAESPVMFVLMTLWGLAQVLAIVYVFSSRLDFADYILPAGAGWAGVVVFTVGVVLLWRAHTDLGRNFSPFLEAKEDHTLVTGGIYNTVRHPMYAAHFLWVIGQALLLHNWLAGASGIILFLPIYYIRVGREESFMLERFGDDYRRYMGRTGRIFPKM